MSTFEFFLGALFLVAATLWVVGLHRMRAPSTARHGNWISGAGMVIGLGATLTYAAVDVGGQTWGWAALALGALCGGAFGTVQARRVKMTEIPQLISIFNALGGGAAATIAVAEFLDSTQALTLSVSIPIVLGVLIGSVTFSGSLIAAGKLQGLVPSQPLEFVGAKALEVGVAAVAVGFGALTVVSDGRTGLLMVALVAALALGVLMVLAIGGADSPVIVSLLNAFTGIAVAMAGFVLDNQALIIAGGLVGAAGTMLTLDMAGSMNRSVLGIVLGGFGTGDDKTVGPGATQDLTNVKQVTADDVAIQLAYAHQVLIVPGYGLAAAQAQHEVAELAKVLGDNGVSVRYAIHPVAGRMPGQMNVLLAEADVPYTQLLQLDVANEAFKTCDVAVVIGANDVCNPMARETGNAISGMAILDVDEAKSIVVIKRSMNTGYAGIANPIFTNPKTGMLFADAKKAISQIVAATKAYITA